MFCENCGAKMTDNDMFCPNCGKKVSIPAAQSAPTQSVNQPEQNAPQQQNNPVVQEAQQPVSTPTAVLEHPTQTVAPNPVQNIPQQNNVPQQQMPQTNPYAQQPQQNPYAMPNVQQPAPQQKKQSNFKITKKMVIIASSIAAVLIIGIVVLIICINNANNPVNKMIDAINNGEYSEAKSIYYSNMDAVNGNQSVVDAIQKKVDEVAEQYNDGTIDYDTAVGKLNSIERVPLSSLTSIYDVRNDIDNINYSKKNFEQAEKYLSNDDYNDAIYYYNLVSEDDSNYSKAQEQKAKAIDGIRQLYLNDAKEEADDQNYAYAIRALQDGLNDEYLKNDEKLTNQINTYVDEVIKKSSELMTAKKYDDAEDMINNMMYVFEKGTGNYTKLQTQLTKIQKETPAYLQDMDINSSDYFYRYQSGSKDVVGNSYNSDNVCTMSVSRYSPDSGAYAEMYVKNYKKVKGTLAVEQASSSITDVTAYIEILDNNKKVLYKSETFTNKSKPVTFEINITDVEWLTIRLVNTKKNANGTINVILADVEFYNIGSSEPDAPAIKEETSKPEISKPESSKPESSKPENSKTESSKAESSKEESSKEESSKTTTSKTESSKAESSKAA